MGGPCWRLLEILYFLALTALELPAPSYRPVLPSRAMLAESMNGRMEKSGLEEKMKEKESREKGKERLFMG